MERAASGEIPPGRVIHGFEELEASVGEELGVSSWLEIGQDEINRFADTTGDHYWIHTDPVRAARSALGGTIAHGLFTLSLGPRFTYEIVRFEGFTVALNLGYNRVRFPAPLPVGFRLRMRLGLTSLENATAGRRATLTQTFEREGGDKPVCVAEALVHFSS